MGKAPSATSLAVAEGHSVPSLEPFPLGRGLDLGLAGRGPDWYLAVSVTQKEESTIFIKKNAHLSSSKRSHLKADLWVLPAHGEGKKASCRQQPLHPLGATCQGLVVTVESLGARAQSATFRNVSRCQRPIWR